MFVASGDAGTCDGAIVLTAGVAGRVVVTLAVLFVFVALGTIGDVTAGEPGVMVRTAGAAVRGVVIVLAVVVVLEDGAIDETIVGFAAGPGGTEPGVMVRGVPFATSGPGGTAAGVVAAGVAAAIEPGVIVLTAGAGFCGAVAEGVFGAMGVGGAAGAVVEAATVPGVIVLTVAFVVRGLVETAAVFVVEGGVAATEPGVIVRMAGVAPRPAGTVVAFAAAG